MSAADMFWAAPPISRTIAAATVLISIPLHMGILIEPYYVAYITQHIFTYKKVPEVWRLASNFFVTGPKLGMILDPYFLYTYSSGLELSSPSMSGPGDYFMYLMFVCGVILLLGGGWLGGAFLLNPLTMALAYTHAQENPNAQINYFVVTFSAKYLPYTMLAMTFVMASPYAALIQATGIPAAHGYLFLTQIWPRHGAGKNYIATPERVKKWFAQPGRSTTQRGAGTAYRPGRATQNVPSGQGEAGGWASGFAGAWRERGAGRRLGGE